MKMYACEDNFSINGAKKDGGYTAQDLKMQLLANGTLNQLVRLYLTADETVKRIDIYQNCTQQAGGKGYNDSAFSLDFFKNSKWKGSRTSYAHYAKGDMVAFIVPEGDATNAKDDQFRAGGYSAVFGVDSDVEQDIELYDADATYAASVLVVHKNATPTFTSVQEEMRVAVIDDI